MALNNSGIMSIGGPTVGSSINLELQLLATANSSLGQTTFRTLAAKPTGQINLSDFYGKANSTNIPINVNTSNFNLNPTLIPGYVAGQANVDVEIGIGAYLYSSTSGSAAMTISNFAAGDKVKLTISGSIQGKGGKGGSSYYNSSQTMGLPGSDAIEIVNSVGAQFTIINNGYLMGGGGGGGSSFIVSGGGGAGGGDGGNSADAGATLAGPTGGGPGSLGTDGSKVSSPIPGQYANAATGGSGGGAFGSGGSAVRAYPGTGNQNGFFNYAGKAAYGGGSGAGYNFVSGPAFAGDGYTGAGGSGINAGGNGTQILPRYASNLLALAGGGGGYGASGGGGDGTFQTTIRNPGGAGGKAIKLNGATVTYSGSGVVSGGIS
jgi:hypothetical protein